jgi:hypothetical protein
MASREVAMECNGKLCTPVKAAVGTARRFHIAAPLLAAVSCGAQRLPLSGIETRRCFQRVPASLDLD